MKNARLLFICILAFGLAACSSFSGSSERRTTDPSPTASDEAPQSYYYDFEDVQVPAEMTFDQESSFVVETMSIKTGVLVFQGRVDPASLVDFYRNNMSRDNWKLRSIFRASRSILVFEKPDKDCVINVIDTNIKTRLEIWVAPRTNSAGRVVAAPPATGYPVPAPGRMTAPGAGKSGANGTYSQPGASGGYRQPAAPREQNLGN